VLETTSSSTEDIKVSMFAEGGFMEELTLTSLREKANVAALFDQWIQSLL
jgi:hypothetical protein